MNHVDSTKNMCKLVCKKVNGFKWILISCLVLTFDIINDSCARMNNFSKTIFDISNSHFDIIFQILSENGNFTH